MFVAFSMWVECAGVTARGARGSPFIIPGFYFCFWGEIAQKNTLIPRDGNKWKGLPICWTHNITSIISTPIYVWWFDHVRIALSRFSALSSMQISCTKNVRHHNLPKSPPNPMFWFVIETYVIGLYINTFNAQYYINIISTPIVRMGHQI